jgi:hypothetical protein
VEGFDTKEKQMLINKARHDIFIKFPNFSYFVPKYVIICTWEGVLCPQISKFCDKSEKKNTNKVLREWHITGYGMYREPRNTFQAVLMTDGKLSFSIFNYKDHGINWLNSK